VRPRVTEVDGRCVAFAIRAKDGTEVIAISALERTGHRSHQVF
jgi:hypothetical protein